MKLTIQDRAEIAVEAAENCNMSARVWTHPNPPPGTSQEVRVYLRRTNAAQTDAGYIRVWTTTDEKGKSEYVQGARYGKGAFTAANEGCAAYDAYRSDLSERKKSKAAV